MPKTPQTGDKAKITIEGTVKGHHTGGLCVEVDTDNSLRLACFAITPDRAVEILAPARPAFINGDVIQSSRHPHEVAVRAGSMWRWTSEPGSGGWDDAITTEHLDSGVYTPIRISGKSSAAQS